MTDRDLEIAVAVILEAQGLGRKEILDYLPIHSESALADWIKEGKERGWYLTFADLPQLFVLKLSTRLTGIIWRNRRDSNFPAR